jgi:addiction module RelE/StbE family toxin
MTSEWAFRAKRSLVSIREFIARERPDTAPRVGRENLEMAAHLARFRHIGRAGRLADTRELVIPSRPWIVIYEVTDGNITILDVQHVARRPM